MLICKAAFSLCHFNVILAIFLSLLNQFHWIVLCPSWLAKQSQKRVGAASKFDIFYILVKAVLLLMLLQTAAEQQIDSSPCVRQTLPLGLHLIGMHGWKHGACVMSCVSASPCRSNVLPSFIPPFFVWIPHLQGIWSCKTFRHDGWWYFELSCMRQSQQGQNELFYTGLHYTSIVLVHTSYPQLPQANPSQVTTIYSQDERLVKNVEHCLPVLYGRL